MPDFNNEAAWITGPKAHPLEVRPGPEPNPAAQEVAIKVAYAAINPVDFKIQDADSMKLQYPTILGTDVAGTVVQVGSDVTKFEIGDRVIGHCDGLLTRKNTNNAFQLYSTCREILVSPVPDSLPLANAAVLPLGVDTAVSALYYDLKLPLPSLEPKPIGKTILIWGGSSSVGSNAIQLAAASGLRVITTASKSNFEFVKSLGATEVYDYRDPAVFEQLAQVLSKGDLVMDCIGSPKVQHACAKILSSLGGGTLPVMMPPVNGLPENVKAVAVMGLASGFDKSELFGFHEGAPHLGPAIWHDFIPAAIKSGKFQAKPDPYILKGGLARVQEGIDMSRKGVSAQKIVIEIQEEA